ncbi:MAG: NADH-quinone oxidoreductase subunit J [archaeon GB-1867-035]|nr:NADH-quinone oxidoreductase subunit J [Candidatus Culexmicrobium profundum]
MEFASIVSLLLGILIVAFAVLAIEIKNITHAILSLCAFSIIIAIAFILLNAPYVAVFQLAIYAGAVTVLFLITIMLTKKEEVELP